ncbi:MAG: ABC transporter permease [Phycisphaeraceae bacterium]|nr:ABC transporter permease [Phycisphaerales bacterium]QOJ16944.1 MAG: ABC transporter permease [Phycisphaeraceae bacterium]
MKKILGILGLLIAICLFTAISSDRFLLMGNVENLVHRTSLFGILAIGAAFVIITGGIDLSIGSMVCLVGVLLPWLLTKQGWPVGAAVPTVLGMSLLIGMTHGLLVTRLKLQPFVVTLCGLLLYRGLARGLTGDQSQGFGMGFKELRSIANGRVPLFGGGEGVFQLPASFITLAVVGVLAWVFLTCTIWGRYLLALGRNEQAARYSGIRTERMTVLAYTICSGLAGLGGMLFVLDINAAQPSDFGNFYELYAIAAAVLGGCSLRGGEGSIPGVVIGAAVMVVLSNTINLVFPRYQNVEFAIIGAVILAGVIVDELVKRAVARRRARMARGGG